MNARLLTLGIGLLLALLLGLAVFVLAEDGRRRRLALRIAERVTPLAPAQAPAVSLRSRLGLDTALHGWGRRLAGVCGYRLERLDAYPLKLPVLLALMLIPAVALDRVAGSALGLSLDPALPLIWVGCAQLLFRSLHARHADRLYRQFPDVLFMIVRSVRAGIPLHEALRVVARESLEPTATQFTRVCDQMAIGIRIDEALRDAALRTGVPEYAFFTVALTLQSQTGGNLAETLDNLAEVIRRRVALRLRAVALASEARTSAYVLAALPIVTGLALAVLNFPYIRPLFATASGNRLLFTAIGMLAMAAGLMRTLIRRSLQ